MNSDILASAIVGIIAQVFFAVGLGYLLISNQMRLSELEERIEQLEEKVIK